MTDLAKKLEALLFITAEELSLEYLKKNLDAKEDNIKEAIKELKNELTNHGLSLIENENHIKLTTNPLINDFITKYIDKETKELSKTAAETLSLIAYRGPIAIHDISIIRGVDSKRIVSQLLRRGLIKKSKSKTEVALYDVSIEFLQNLGLKNKSELPEFDKLSNNEIIRALIADNI